MAMGETSSDCGVLGAFASKIRVWRCVHMDLVQICVYSENIPFFQRFQRFPGSSVHIRAAPPTHTHIYCPRLPHRSAMDAFTERIKQYPAKEQAELHVRVMLPGKMFPGLLRVGAA